MGIVCTDIALPPASLRHALDAYIYIYIYIYTYIYIYMYRERERERVRDVLCCCITIGTIITIVDLVIILESAENRCQLRALL